MAILNGWILTDSDGKQWTFEEEAYDGGLVDQKAYLVKLSGDTLTLDEAEALITNGTWRMEQFEQPEV